MLVGGTMNSGCIRWVISASAAVTSVMCFIAVSMPTPSKGKYNILLPPRRRLCFIRHLSVCLLATSRENYWSDFDGNFTTDQSVQGREKLAREVVGVGPTMKNVRPPLQRQEKELTGRASTPSGMTLVSTRNRNDDSHLIGKTWPELCRVYTILVMCCY